MARTQIKMKRGRQNEHRKCSGERFYRGRGRIGMRHKGNDEKQRTMA